MKTKNQIQFLLFIALMAVLNTSCIVSLNGIYGTGNVVSETRDVQKFSSVELLSSADVDIIKGDLLLVSISDYENILQYWDLNVENSTLIIKTKPFTSLINSKAKVAITLPEPLYSAAIAGSGNIKIHSGYSDLEKLSISGSGNIISDQNYQYNKLNIQLTGSGNIQVVGSVQNLNAKISGSGDLQLNQLKAQSADCTISGSGNMYVFVESSLKASITGSGDIIYSGSPTLDLSSTGSGHIRHN